MSKGASRAPQEIRIDFAVVPLLALAALVEAYVTPVLLALVM